MVGECGFNLNRLVKKGCERPYHAQWARPAGHTNRKASAISGGFLQSTLERLIHFGENDHESKECERLDERKTQNQRDKDSRRTTWVTTKRLPNLSSRLPLTQAA